MEPYSFQLSYQLLTDSKGGAVIGSSYVPTGPEGSNGKLQVHGHIDGLGGTQMVKRFVEEGKGWQEQKRQRRKWGESSEKALYECMILSKNNSFKTTQ